MITSTWNDILMDTYGCGLMMVLLMLLGVKNKPLPRFWKRTEVYGLAVLLLLILFGAASGFISAYANDAAWLVMNERSTAEPFGGFMWRISASIV
ncbi:MAG: hypothetical protein IPH78_13960 [Bacteroidetes bacterium]|nr:hypothetical protein [Bacteroidota bacterium]